MSIPAPLVTAYLKPTFKTQQTSLSKYMAPVLLLSSYNPFLKPNYFQVNNL